MPLFNLCYQSASAQTEQEHTFLISYQLISQSPSPINDNLWIRVARVAKCMEFGLLYYFSNFPSLETFIPVNVIFVLSSFESKR